MTQPRTLTITDTPVCKYCAGKGKRLIGYCLDTRTTDNRRQVPLQEAEQTEYVECPTCNGSGRVRITKVIQITVEPYTQQQ